MNFHKNFYLEIKTIRPECNGGKILKFHLIFHVKNFHEFSPKFHENSVKKIKNKKIFHEIPSGTSKNFHGIFLDLELRIPFLLGESDIPQRIIVI